MSELLLHFPEKFTPNESQKTIIKKIELALSKNKKFIIVNAPTGSGKTFLPKTLGNYVNGPSNFYMECVDNYSIFSDEGANLIKDETPFGVYVLTITKTLQDQYKNTFSDTGVLKGQSNYNCALDEEMSVDIASCNYISGLKRDCWMKNLCPYYNARNHTLKQPFSTLNYSMFFSLPTHLRKRQIIVCDEGSELEEQIVSQFSCEIDIPFLKQTNTSLTPFPLKETPVKVLTWLKETLGSINKNIESYKDWMSKSNKSSKDFAKTQYEYNRLYDLCLKIGVLVETYNDSHYIIEKIEKIIKFIPLKVDKLTKHIFDYADHVIIMSATIINHKNFCKTLGIDDYEYIEVDSVFDPEKAPIHILINQKLNFMNLKDMLPKIAKQVKELLDEHKNEKGIIHTHTQFIANYIRENVKSDRLLCREPGVRNEEILEEHLSSSRPTVLVSPSMSYGVDLAGDLAKFQIILKAPWLPTKEKRVEQMMKENKQWYVDKMLATLVQACGRGVRSQTDECVTYILDGSIFDVVVKNKPKLPKYFIERFD